MATPVTPAQLSHTLTIAGLPMPSAAFLTTILTSTSQRQAPLTSLSATARIRLLAADFTTQPSILSPSNASLPAGITDVRVKEKILTQDVCVQVLDVEDIGCSKWEQIESLEGDRKGERMKGREVIRVVPQVSQQDGDLGSTASTQAVNMTNASVTGTTDSGLGSRGPFKLLLQDMKGSKVYGFELQRVAKIGFPPGMSIGCKIVLKKGCKVARGMVLLDPATCAVLGGKIDCLDRAWRDGREERLRAEVKKDEERARRAS